VSVKMLFAGLKFNVCIINKAQSFLLHGLCYVTDGLLVSTSEHGNIYKIEMLLSI